MSSAEVIEAVVGSSPDATPQLSPKPFDLEWVTLTTRDNGLQFRVQLIQAPQGGHRALLGPPGVVAVGLYELDVAA